MSQWFSSEARLCASLRSVMRYHMNQQDRNRNQSGGSYGDMNQAEDSEKQSTTGTLENETKGQGSSDVSGMDDTDNMENDTE